MSHLRKRNAKIATLDAARTIFFIVVGLAIKQSLGLFAHDWPAAQTNGPAWWTWNIRALVGIGYIATALRYCHGISQLYGYEKDQIENSGLPTSSRVLGLSLFLALLGILFYLMADNITRFEWFLIWTGLMLLVDFVYIALSRVVRNPTRRLIRWLPARIFSAIRGKENSWIDTAPGYAADAALEWMTSDVVMLGFCLLFLFVLNKNPHERLFATVLILGTVIDYYLNREFYFGGRSDKRNQKIVFVCSPLIGDLGADAPKQLKEGHFRQNIKRAQVYCTSLMKTRTIIPFASHAFYPYFLNLLDETDPTDKILSRYCGLAFLRACDAIYVYVPFTKQPLTNLLRFVKVNRPDVTQLSSGMEQEIVEAKKLGLDVVYKRTDHNEPNNKPADWCEASYPKPSNQTPLDDLEAMKRIYVCTPFRGPHFSNLTNVEKQQTLERNIRSALWYCRELVRGSEQAVAPFAPQAFYPYFVPMFERKSGWDHWFIRSLEILKVCDAVYVYTNDGLPNKEFISVGMSHIIRLAEALGIEIKYKRASPVPDDWSPALPQFNLTDAISDLPEVPIPVEELKTVPTMGRRDDQKESPKHVGSNGNNSIVKNGEPMSGAEDLSHSRVENTVEASPSQVSDAPAGLKQQEPKTFIYFAAPLFTQAEWQWNERLSTELQSCGLGVILPQATAYPMLKGEEQFDPQKLFQSNLAALEATDIVLAVLDQADPDSGTSWECGYAFKIGLPIIGLRTDIRGGGDTPDGSVNLMLLQSCQAFINVPLSQRDDVEWIASEIAEAVKRLESHGV